MGKEVERIVNAERVEDLIAVFGSIDENIKRIEDALHVKVVNRGTDLRVTGDEEMAWKDCCLWPLKVRSLMSSVSVI